MTREIAIEGLKAFRREFSGYEPNEEMFDMAIKALEHPEKNVVAIVPCGDTISRQAVIDLMMQKWGENFSGDDAMQESIDAIRVLPSVTPQEPRKGSWISSNGVPYTYFNSFIVCSECGKHPEKKSNFCSNCGADMRGEE